jgi:AraC-like DNA-binding protein
MSIEGLESLFSMSRSALFKAVKNITGLSTIDFIISLRIERAKSLLLDDRGYSVKEICGAVGYDDQHYFSRVFKRWTGALPAGIGSPPRKRTQAGNISIHTPSIYRANFIHLKDIHRFRPGDRQN